VAKSPTASGDTYGSAIDRRHDGMATCSQSHQTVMSLTIRGEIETGDRCFDTAGVEIGIV
jgi:hypothetical protein